MAAVSAAVGIQWHRMSADAFQRPTGERDDDAGKFERQRLRTFVDRLSVESTAFRVHAVVGMQCLLSPTVAPAAVLDCPNLVACVTRLQMLLGRRDGMNGPSVREDASVFYECPL